MAHPESVAEAHKYASCNDGKWTDPNCRGYEWVERACDAIYQWRHQDTTKRVEFDFYVWASAQYDQDGALYDSPAADCPWSLSLHRPDWAARSTVVMVTYNGRYRSERTFELQPVGCTDCTVAVILPCYRQAPMVNLNWSVR